MLATLLTRSITMSWAIATLIVIVIVRSPAPTKPTLFASTKARLMLHKEHS